MKGTASLEAYAGQYVNLTGEGSLLVQGAFLAGKGTLSVPGQPISATLSGTSELFSLAFFGPTGTGYLAPLTCIGGDSEYCVAPNQQLAPLTVFAYGGLYVPATPVMGYANLQPLVSVGHIIRTHTMTGDAELSPLLAKGGDYRYSEAPSHDYIHQRIAPLVSLGTEGTDLVVILQRIYAGDENIPTLDSIIIITDSGVITDTITGSSVAIQQMLSALEGSTSFSVLGEFNLSMLSELIGASRSMAVIAGKPGMNDAGAVWCVNMETGASAQYEQYGFNSLFDGRDGYYYGIAEDGIYRLDGDTDAGNEINSLIDFGKHDFGSPQKKRIKSVYIGASSGKLLLKVIADGQEYVYEMRSSSADAKNHRVDIGRGLKGNYWTFVLLNQGGEDFDLESVHFEPIALSRKI